MFVIITEWFSMPLTFIVLFINATLFAAGLIAALKIKARKTIIIIMLTEAVLYFICTAMVKLLPFVIGAYAIYAGAILLLSFVGFAVGLLTLSAKKYTCT